MDETLRETTVFIVDGFSLRIGAVRVAVIPAVEIPGKLVPAPEVDEFRLRI